MTVLFPELAQLLDHDPDKMQRVVWEFYRSATKDLHHLEQAVATQQWQAARDLARRIRVSCLQVGDRDAAVAAAVLAGMSSACFAETYSPWRSRIESALERAEQFIGGRISARNASSDAVLADTTKF
jgi:hypothetical protein